MRGRGKIRWLKAAWLLKDTISVVLKEVIALIDAGIATLKEARAILAAGSAVTVAKRKAGRPPKVQPGTATTPKRKKKHNLPPEGRARIAEAAKKRWAAQKKAAK